jgi:hypothetical protein
MQKILFYLLLGCALSAKAAYNPYFFQKTLRVDLHHTGNHLNELFSLDELIEEAWYSGPLQNTLGFPDYGTHKFELSDVESGKILFSKGWNSLFHEWQSTLAARESYKTYSESLVMPFPRKSVILRIFTRLKTGLWHEKFHLIIDPDNKYISREKRKTAGVFDVHIGNAEGPALDIVFLAEGYTRRQLPKFRNDCKRFAGYLLACNPFTNYADKINIRAVEAISEHSGTDNPGLNIWVNTALNSSFYTFGTDRYLTTPDIKKIRDYAANVPYDHIIIITNSKEYGGGGFYNFYSLATSDHAFSNYLLIHEFGHGLAGLADEYYSSEVAYNDYYPKNIEPWEPNITTLVNFESKWKPQLAPETPVPTPAIAKYSQLTGVFEGAGYSEKGIFRPAIDCTMKSLSWGNFCAICRLNIRKTIEAYCEQ